MKLILLSDVKALGKAGDVVKVSDGYARNMLLPQGLAVEDTDKNRNDLKLKKQHEDRIAAERKAEAEELASKLQELKITVSMKAGEGGKPFGSVSSKEIVEAAREQFGLELDKKKIQMDEPIRTFGMRQVPIRLHPQVTGTLYVLVREQ
ncbi:MAG: 50S ribosomal protein L9 [Lachnospiraceae bacterium]|nr:50S ribosomal protein L9 [Lachnospiraceae bacterium]